jgi:hypothetical protein
MRTRLLASMILTLAPGAVLAAGMEALSRAEAEAHIAELRATITPDLGSVLVLRMAVAGEVRDVTSLRPEWYAAEGDATDGTLITFSPERDALIVLTLAGDDAWRWRARRAELAEGARFDVPMWVDGALEREAAMTVRVVAEQG